MRLGLRFVVRLYEDFRRTIHCWEEGKVEEGEGKGKGEGEGKGSGRKVKNASLHLSANAINRLELARKRLHPVLEYTRAYVVVGTDEV